MKKISKLFRPCVVIALSIVFAVSASFCALASSRDAGYFIIYLGAGTVGDDGDDLHYILRSHVGYQDDTPESITIRKLIQYIENIGEIEVNEVTYKVFNDITGGSGVHKSHMTSSELQDPVFPGEYVRVEQNWDAVCASWGENTTYDKVGIPPYVETDIQAGILDSFAPGWSCIFFSDHYEAYFYQ